jgi:hypothetical protein
MRISSARVLCLCCPVYRPQLKPRWANVPSVCEVCRWRLCRDVSAIDRLHYQLAGPDDLVADRRQVAVLNGAGLATGELRWCDPAAAVLPAGVVASRVNATAGVSGTRDPQAPISLDVVDLIGPAVHATIHDPFGDQVGYLSAATVLDSWVRLLREELFGHERLPGATVGSLADWLVAGGAVSRLEIACSRFLAVVDMTVELRDLLSALRSVAGETEPQPRRYWGVPCRGCNTVSQLVQEDDFVECERCQLLLNPEEFQQWLTTAAQRWGS